MPTVLLALDAELLARGPDGERTIAAGDFFTGFLETALSPGSADRDPGAEARLRRLDLREVQPARPGLGDRRVAAVASNGGANVALTNMAPTPVRAKGVEEALAGGADAAAAAEKAADGTSPPSDTNASADFRRHLAQVLTRRALEAIGNKWGNPWFPHEPPP